MPLLRILRSIADKITGGKKSATAPKSGTQPTQGKAPNRSAGKDAAPDIRRGTEKPQPRRDRPDSDRPPRDGRRQEGSGPRRSGPAPHRDQSSSGRSTSDRPASDRSAPDRAPRPRHQPPRSVKPSPPIIPDVPWDPAEFTVEPAEDKKRFHDFNLPETVMHAIYDAGFRYCSPIQAETLDQTIAGANVAGRAQTGTGKTAAYLIAVLHRMLANPDTRPSVPGRPAALVIAPTRELVIQVIKDADLLGKYCGLRSLAVFGGMDHAAQQDRLESAPVDLIAATPGRLLDFVNSRVINLKEVKILVIDEADRMLDMGFIPDVKRIIRELPAKDARQTLLFSATLTEEVMTLASQWMPDPVEVSIDPEHGTVDTITQVIYPIAAKEKFTVLFNTLKENQGKRFLIFRNRKRDCDDLCRELAGHDIHVEQLSGDVDQKKRIRILEDFREGRIHIVVATDVAGRGIHVDDIAYVVNYDFPYEADDYIHRIGRTGRAGSTGTAISFACEDESFIIPDIEKLLGEELHCEQPAEHLFQQIPAPSHFVPRKQTASSSSYGGARSGPPRGGPGGFRKPRGNLRSGR